MTSTQNIAQAQDEGLVTADDPLDRRLSAGQYMERREVFEAVLMALPSDELEEIGA